MQKAVEILAALATAIYKDDALKIAEQAAALFKLAWARAATPDQTREIESRARGLGVDESLEEEHWTEPED
jgi:hypothetical protein